MSELIQAKNRINANFVIFAAIQPRLEVCMLNENMMQQEPIKYIYASYVEKVILLRIIIKAPIHD